SAASSTPSAAASAPLTASTRPPASSTRVGTVVATSTESRRADSTSTERSISRRDGGVLVCPIGSQTCTSTQAGRPVAQRARHMADYIFSMKGLTKVHPPDKKIVSDLYLSFLPNAKIGIIGSNGSGKSTILRIMAGVDTNYTGECWTKAGLKVGYLPQEPDLGGAKTVREAVEMAVKPIRDVITEFEELSMKLGDPMSDDEMTKLLEKQGRLQDQIDAVDGWNLDHALEIAMDALRLPPGDADTSVLSGGEKRRVALCRL